MVNNDIQKEVLTLNKDEKIHLVKIILDSIGTENEEIEKIWVEESERRYKAYLAGETEAYPLADVLKRMENEV
ncbi:MAG: addiction module protein [Fidelibacterota bacterium]